MLSLLLLLAPAPAPVAVAADDWPWWRGPTRDGVAAPRQAIPDKWDADAVLWSAAVPGRGHGSAIVVGDQVCLLVAEESAETQSVLCLSRKDGKRLWETPIHKGGFVKGGNGKSSHASSTLACDGKRLFAVFPNDAAIRLACLDRDGKVLWREKVADYVMHQGYGSSPAVFGPLVLVNADHKGGGATAAFDRGTGKRAWSNPRPKLPNYASPIILPVGGKETLFLSGTGLVTALDPLTGEKRWELRGSTEECVTSTVSDGERVFTSGGYPRNHVAAYRDGKLVWENGTRVYVPSMIVSEGHLYAVTDAGVAMCWKSGTGEERWKGRLEGTFSASPVLVDGVLFATNEKGETFRWKASPEGFKLLGKSRLGDECFSTPAVCGGRVYLRVACTEKGIRQERLYCLWKR